MTLDRRVSELAPNLAPVVDRLLDLAEQAGGRWIAAAGQEVTALLHGTTTAPAEDPGEVVCREFAQQFVFGVSALTVSDVDRLRSQVGSDLAVYEFVSSLWVLDLVGRVEAVTSQVLER